MRRAILLSLLLHGAVAAGFFWWPRSAPTPTSHTSLLVVWVEAERETEPPPAPARPPTRAPSRTDRKPPSAALPAPTGDAPQAPAGEGNVGASVAPVPAQDTTTPAPAPAAPAASLAYVAPRPWPDNPRPHYPRQARRMGWEGDAVLRAHIGPQGENEKVELIASTGFPVLDEAAMAAVRAWRFDPARQGADPVSASLDLPVSFRLRD